MPQNEEHSLAYYKKLVEDQRAIIQHKDAFIQRIFDVFRIDNTRSSLGEKVAWLLVQPMIAKQKPNGEGLVRIPISALAEGMGMSTDSAARYVKKPCERYNATRKIVPYTTLAGQESNLTFINPDDPYWQDIETAPLPEGAERKINGNHTCHCGGTIKKTKRVTKFQRVHECQACGEKTVFQEETGLRCLAEGFTPGNKATQTEHLTPADSIDTIEATQTEDLVIHDLPEAEYEATQTEHLTLSDDKPEHLPLLYVPNTPPHMLDLSSHDIETETAALLLEIAGDHSEHIKMVPNDSKYITMKKPLQLWDMRAHIRGYKTLGTRLYYADGTTRALRYDGDSPDQWERCKEAARLLDRAFISILEPSPAPADCPGYHSGGGALWVIFDATVNAYSAKKTVEKYTGDLLQDIKEVWPPETDSGNRARLPGGMYIMKGFKERCKLYTSDGEEITRLSDYLTPACAVDPYDKPEPEPEPIKTTQEAQARGVLGKDVKKSIIQVLNDDLRWDDLAARAGGRDKRGYFLAAWRGDNKKPNVFVDPDTDLAKDFSSNAWPGGPFDKYDCLTRLEYFDECQRSGTACSYEGWKAYKRAALDTLKADKQHLHIIPLKVAPAPEPQHDHEHKQATSPYSELAHDLGIPEGQPCEKCGCTLSYQSAGYTMCYRCLPRSEKRGGLTEEQAQRLAAIPRLIHAIQRRAS